MAVTYIWKKYNSKATSTPTGKYRDSYVDDVTLTGSSYTKALRLGESYSFDKSTGKYTLSSVDSGPVSWLEQGNGPYLMSVSSPVTTADYVYKYISGSLETTGTSSSSSFTVRAEKRQAVAETTTTYSQGTYISDVTSTSSSAYPKNGRHSDGYWYVYQGNNNVAPTTPGTPTLSSSEIKGGDTITVSWTKSTDSNSNLSGYQLYVSLDGGSWAQAYKGSSTSYSYTVPESAESIAFRVRAYDALSAYSSYATSSAYTVKSATLGEQPVGSIVKLNVNGTYTNFIVVNQGNPSSSIYDSSCNGTWLLMQDIYELKAWADSWTNDYHTSSIHSYLTNTFYNLFNTDIRNNIKTVKLPYTDSSRNLVSGSSGLSSTVFLLSLIEVGLTETSANAEGTVLSYFNGADNSKRIAYFSGEPKMWWTRTSNKNDRSNTYEVMSNGLTYVRQVSNTSGVRPALILPQNLFVSNDGMVYVNNAPSTPGKPSCSGEIKAGETTNVSWTASSSSNISGYQLEVSINDDSWTFAYTGSAISCNYEIPMGAETIAFRVKAHNSSGMYSAYATSDTYDVMKPDIFLGYTNIDGINRQLISGYTNIDGVWKSLINKSFINIDGTWKSMLTGTEVVSALPDGYVQLEYIESTGTQYIDTGFKPNQNTRVVADMNVSLKTTIQALFGARHSYQSNSFNVFSLGSTDGGGYQSDYASNAIVNNTIPSKGRHDIDRNKNVFLIDGVTLNTYTATTFSCSYSIYLFTINNGGSTMTGNYPTTAKLYSCQIYDNGTLIRDFIPCMSPDGIVGLYDTVGGTFYPNNGTGEFVAGEPVAMSSYPMPKNFIQAEYIESTGTQWINTGVSGSSNIGFEIDFMTSNVVGPNSTDYGTIFGAFTSASTRITLGTWNSSQVTTGGEMCWGSKTYNPYITSKTRMQVSILGTTLTTPNGVQTTSSGTFTSGATIGLFARNNNGTADQFSKTKLYSFKLYENNILVRDFIPCINVSGVAGLWDKITGKFYGNNGTGMFHVGAYLSAPIPDGFTLLQYIQSSGTQYINTGFKANQNTRIVVDCQALSASSSGSAVFGSRIDYNQVGFDAWILQSAVFYHFGTTYKQPSFAKYLERMIIDANKNVCTFTTISGAQTTATNTNRTFTTPNNILLCACDYNGTSYPAENAFVGKIYSCQMYDNGTLIRNFIPCVNTSGEAGMWDSVNGVFYGNAGTGSFTAGN